MKQRLTALLLTLVLTVGLVPMGAQAASGTNYGAHWTYSSGVLTIAPEKGGNGKVTCGGWEFTPWWEHGYDKEIHTIIVEEGITRIDGALFLSCENTEKLYLPASLEFLSSDVFSWYYFDGEGEGMDIYYPGSPEKWDALCESTLTDWVSNSTIHYYYGQKFNLFLDPQGGTMEPFHKTLQYGDTYGTLPTPTLDGYVFAGWYTEAEGGYEVSKNRVHRLGSDVTFYARWNSGAPQNKNYLNNFAPTTPYTPGQFTDVNTSDWFAGNVQRVCEFGLMNGTGTSTFSPKGNLTVAQVVTIAARLHSIYHGNGYQFTQTSPWYKTYTDYAVNKKLVQAGTNFDAVCSRSTFAAILAGAIPASEFPAINSVSRIPDIHKIDWYASSVYTLYNAGIIQGNDAHGVFAPNSSITRAETAAILSRIVDKTQRVSFTLDTSWYYLQNPSTQRVFYGPNGKKINVVHADRISPTGDWGFYSQTYQGDFAGMPKISTSWSTLYMTYGSERDTYNAYFYVQGREQIVVVLVNALTGEQKVCYQYDLMNSSGEYVGMCLINVFDQTDQMYMYRTYYWNNGNYSFTKMIPASAYDE